MTDTTTIPADVRELCESRLVKNPRASLWAARFAEHCVMADRAARQSNADKLAEAAEAVIAGASDTYRKRNGHTGSIEGDDGEKCWIVSFDPFEALRTAFADCEQGKAVADDGWKEKAERAFRALTYPCDTSIQAKGYGLRTDEDSVGYAAELLHPLPPAPQEGKAVAGDGASSRKFSIQERDDDMLIAIDDWQFGWRCIARRPKMMTNEQWRPEAEEIVAALSRTLPPAPQEGRER